MNKYGMAVLALSATVVLAGGCATTPEGGEKRLSEAATPAWSLKDARGGMIVAVSPARRTLQIAGTSGALLGAGIDAITNAKYRSAVQDALEGYDAGAVFEERIRAGLEETLGDSLMRAAPFGSAAGYSTTREAEQARYRSIAKEGGDVLLELRMSYGLFGYQGILVAKIDGELVSLPEGRRLWDNAIVVSTEPILANAKLTDPTKRLGPNFTSPRLTVDEDAISRWTGDGGEALRRRFEEAAQGAVAALLDDLALREDAKGAYYLGKLALARKRFEEAARHFGRAAAMESALTDARNGLSVTYAHQKKLDQAISLAKDITRTEPGYGPAWFNLAWWYAVEKNDPAAAKPYCDRAMALDMPGDEKLEKALAP